MLRCVFSALLGALLMSGTAQAEVVNQWTQVNAVVNDIPRGWLELEENDIDGRYCLFSGHSANTVRNDVLCFDSGTRTWNLASAGTNSTTPPIGGDLHAWGWDPVADEYLLFDGKFAQQSYAFHYPTRVWRPLTNSDFPGIGARVAISNAGTATSPEHRLMVIVHGTIYGSPTSVVRYLTLDAAGRRFEETVTGVNPPARGSIQNQFLYIPTLQKFLLFGGEAGTGLLNDLWLLDPATRTWTPVVQTNPPPGTALAHMAYDAAQNVVYLSGGSGLITSHVWVLNLDTWTWQQLPTPSGTAGIHYPKPRQYGASLFDPAVGFCTVFGALSNASSWLESLANWCFQHQFTSDTTPPDAPGPGTANFIPSNLGDLSLSWPRSSADPDDVDHYELQRSTNGGASYLDQINIPATGAASYSHIYQGVPQGPARVRSVDDAGNASVYVPIEN